MCANKQVDQLAETLAETLPFQIDYLPDFFREKAESELDETPENKVRLLQELKDMAEDHEAMKHISLHADLLQQFLRRNKYNVSKAFSRLKASVIFKSKYGRLFDNVPNEKLSSNASYKFGTPLPFRSPDGCGMILFEHGKWNTADITFEDLNRLGLLIYEQSLRNPMSQINGYKAIHDFKDTSLSHLKLGGPHNLYLVYKAFLDCIPARFKEFHVVNPSTVMALVWPFFRSCLSEKLTKRIIFHSCPEELLEYFPRNVLPVQYGGDLKSYYMEDWMKSANEQQRLSTVGGQANFF